MQARNQADSTRYESERITREAVDWFVRLEGAGPLKRAAFVRWLRVSGRHIDEYLAVTDVWYECGNVVGPAFGREALIREAIGAIRPH